MIPFWSFILFCTCFTVIGYLCGHHMGRYREWKDNLENIKFERARLRTTDDPHRTVTAAAANEPDRPHARVSRGGTAPSRLKKSKKV